MKLIADSGSTKTMWCVVAPNGEKTTLFTSGINPFLQSEEEISNSIKTELVGSITADEISEIYFYGAGCANEEKCNVVASALADSFPNASIEVNSDMLAAARGMLGKESGIACILGTGANSCYYDGEKIAANVSAGGFILGDEGSGAVIGKRLMSDYIKNQMPEKCRQDLEKECGVDVSTVIDKVYRHAFPNRYLAGFTRFLSTHIDEEYCHKLVYDCFVDFFMRNVRQYDGSERLPVNFVGSIAFYFSEILNDAACNCGFKVGQIVQNPVDGLVEYHRF